MSLNPSRPSSSELVELHVFYVPEGSWNYKLNTISIEVINKFISAGFIRVSPELTLQALRERLGEFLGVDAVAEKFLFLKCIGNNLAVLRKARLHKTTMEVLRCQDHWKSQVIVWVT